MDCRDIKQHIDAYWDRELAADAAARVRTHLNQCPACHAEYGGLDDLLGTREPVAVPVGLRDRVLNAVMQTKDASAGVAPLLRLQHPAVNTAIEREESENIRFRRWLVPLAWAGALAACVAMLLINRPGLHPPGGPTPHLQMARGTSVSPLAVPGLLFAAMQPGQLPFAGAAVVQAAALEQITQSNVQQPLRVNRRPLRDDYVPMQDDRGVPLPAVMSAVSRTLGA
jgi:anti-sigma factor (TIGR02949 family)